MGWEEGGQVCWQQLILGCKTRVATRSSPQAAMQVPTHPQPQRKRLTAVQLARDILCGESTVERVRTYSGQPVLIVCSIPPLHMPPPVHTHPGATSHFPLVSFTRSGEYHT
ncbi:hypothetical protein PISMIDRAFT_183114 [Pisolithus microcarpus 441]|uniref:Uncharacterized protein n=1 Tax=Pisolithus microcarpus 441 TaxID=765257 RepID=A0A0D0A5N3_9AGAM|nr:hypothetical protein PISMIDRAFT_183114 [Pisolithus microcarpus 441]